LADEIEPTPELLALFSLLLKKALAASRSTKPLIVPAMNDQAEPASAMRASFHPRAVRGAC
jgi:hypothetical protein